MASNTPSSDLAASKIISLSGPEIVQVPVRLIANHERKTTKLLSNSADQQALQSRNSYFVFSFQEPIFILTIEISLADFVDGSNFEYKWEGADGVLHEGNTYSKSNEIKIPIQGIAKSISFKPPRSYFTKPYINSVDIYGFELSKAGEFISFADRVSKIKEQAISEIAQERLALDDEKKIVAALQAQRGSLNQDITSSKASVAREQGKLKRIESQRDEFIAKNGELERAISDEENRLQDLKSEINRSASLRSSLSNSIIKKKKRLSDLESNIHLFPSELSDFSRQGAKDSRAFLMLSLAPSALIILMFWMLVRGAADLTTKITGSESINLAALAVSRGPYVIIACTIITASYYLSKLLVLEMVRISRQRLALTKISIIAKDISSSIDYDLSLSEDEKYNTRLILKMDMMKNHLKEYLSSDFVPTLPNNIAPSLGLLNPGNWKTKNDDKIAE